MWTACLCYLGCPVTKHENMSCPALQSDPEVLNLCQALKMSPRTVTAISLCRLRPFRHAPFRQHSRSLKCRIAHQDRSEQEVEPKPMCLGASLEDCQGQTLYVASLCLAMSACCWLAAYAEWNLRVNWIDFLNEACANYIHPTRLLQTKLHSSAYVDKHNIVRCRV